MIWSQPPHEAEIALDRASRLQHPMTSEKNIYPAGLQTDLLVGSENSISFARCCGGSHFARFGCPASAGNGVSAAEEKVAILRRHLLDKVPASDL